jgi:hypothetical protein
MTVNHFEKVTFPAFQERQPQQPYSPNNLESEMSSPIRSQAGSLDSRESSPIAKDFGTQAAFATQALHINSAPKSAPKIPRSSLLDVLVGQNRAFTKTANIQESAQSTTRRPILQPVTGQREVDVSSSLKTKAIVGQSSTASKRASQVNTTVEEQDIPTESQLSFTARSFPVDDTQREKCHKQAMIQNRSPRPDRSKLLLEHEALPSPASFMYHVNPFIELIRVPRRHVRVSEAQQILLQREDSWVHSEIGGRSMYANVPHEVLQGLQSNMKRNSVQNLNNHDREDLEDREPGGGSDESEKDSDVDPVDLPQSGSHSIWTDSTPRPSVATGENMPDEVDESENDAISWALSSPAVTDNLRDFPATSPVSPDTEVNIDIPFQTYARHELVPAVPSLSRLQVASFNFPTSSPNDEEEFELDVPHAIGDEVGYEGNRRAAGAPQTFQKLPSTAVQSRPIIQVLQTPYFNHRPIKVSRSDEIHSDPYIPATFNDVSPQERSSVLEGIYTSQEMRLKGVYPVTEGSEIQDRHIQTPSPTRENAESREKSASLDQRYCITANSSQRRSAKEQSPLPPSNFISEIKEASCTYESGNGSIESHISFSPPLSTLEILDSPPLRPLTFPQLERTLDPTQHNLQRNPTKSKRFIELSQAEYVLEDTSAKAKANREMFFQDELKSDEMHVPAREAPRTESAARLADFNGIFEIPDNYGESSIKNTTTDTQNSHPAIIDTFKFLNDMSSGIPSTETINERSLVLPDRQPGSVLSAYDEFISAYPSYLGNNRRFTAGLVYLEFLRGNGEDEGQYFHQFLWDDFIRVLAGEYKQYVEAESNEPQDEKNSKPLTGFRWFNKRGEDPIFTKRVINQVSLGNAIASMDVDEVKSWRERFASDGKNHIPNIVRSAKSTQQDRPTGPSKAGIVAQDSESKEPNAMARSKRLFFETTSQNSEAKRRRTDVLEVQIGQTPSSSRPLPWAKNIEVTSQVLSTSIPKLTARCEIPAIGLPDLPRPNISSPRLNILPQVPLNPSAIPDESKSNDTSNPLPEPSNSKSDSKANPHFASKHKSVPTSTNVSTPPKGSELQPSV